MEAILLGVGSTNPIPLPTCDCEICKKARVDKKLYSTRPSLYVHEGILVDTPIEIREQINREDIKQINHVFYTHRHPDHTYGLFLFEDLYYSNINNFQPCNVYIPLNAIEDFQTYVKDIFFLEKQGFIKIHLIEDRKEIKINNISVIPLDMYRTDRVRYNYLFIQDNKKLLYSPCSCFEMKIDDKFYSNIDCLIMEYGRLGDSIKLREDYKNGINNFEHRSYKDHISFLENIDYVKKINPKMTYLIHGNTHDTYREIDNLSKQYGVIFPNDGEKINL